ncbi:hypothetical protein BDV29DRAFT_200197 [Aspergillus leporis]|uniref:HNH nuclease domain-containing protein n=1 Tax=Aspergillus leporis TaxID=41062 RepID=A0A5N5XAA0_9EURO|nr:hypothetical protein BDV29DRAFT_200197 [Aspergillus leporis]
MSFHVVSLPISVVIGHAPAFLHHSSLLGKFHTEERTSLIELLASETHVVTVNSCTWACAWLSDLSALKKMVEEAKDTSIANKVRSALKARETVDVIKSCEFRMLPHAPTDQSTDATPVKRQYEDTTKLFPPSKIPRKSPKESQDMTESSTGSPQLISQCTERDNGRCVITKAALAIDVAHIYPFALGKRRCTEAHDDFWLTLRVYCIIGPGGSETLINRLCLAASIHRMWGKAEFGLKPIELSDDRKKLTVQFFWFKRGSFSERMPLTKAPVLLTTGRAGPRDTKVFNCLTEEVICSGDFVTLEVQDPDQYPLPSFELLEMQWTLHMVAAISGAAEAPDDPYDPELDDVTEEELSDIFFDEERGYRGFTISSSNTF